MNKLKALTGAICIVLGLTAGTLGYQNTNSNKFTGYSVEHYQKAEEDKEYTILVYMDGSNLESSYGEASKDIEEMIDNYPKDSNINLVCETGGSQDWYKDELTIGGEGNRRFCIDDNGIKNTQKIEKRNMGDKNTLADFLNYGIESYPADKYILIFWNHGSGSVKGFGDDELFDDDSLELDEINAAFEKSIAKDINFELIGFDACLMGTIEMANIFKDRGKYFAASQDLEPGGGWDYKWINSLNTSLNGEEIGKRIADSYVDSYADKNMDLTMSLIDLGKVGGIVNYLDENINNNFIAQISSVRNKLLSYGNGAGGTVIGEMADLRDLVYKMNEMMNKDNIQFDNLVNNVVAYKRTSGKDSGDSGLSIYVPVNSNEDLAEQYKRYRNTTFLSKYINFISEYNRYLEQNDPNADYNQYELGLKNNIVTIKVDEEEVKNISAAYLAECREYKNGVYYYLGTDSDVNIDKDGTITSDISDNATFLSGVQVCTIEKEFTDDYVEYLSPALLNGRMVNLILKYDIYNSYGAIEGAVPFNDKSVDSKIIEIQGNDEIIPLFPIKEDSDAEKVDDEDLYDNKYIKGSKINAHNGHLDVSTKTVEDTSQMIYGYIIYDNKQQARETQFINNLE